MHSKRTLFSQEILTQWFNFIPVRLLAICRCTPMNIQGFWRKLILHISAWLVVKYISLVVYGCTSHHPMHEINFVTDIMFDLQSVFLPKQNLHNKNVIKITSIQSWLVLFFIVSSFYLILFPLNISTNIRCSLTKFSTAYPLFKFQPVGLDQIFTIATVILVKIVPDQYLKKYSTFNTKFSTETHLCKRGTKFLPGDLDLIFAVTNVVLIKIVSDQYLEKYSM